VTDKKEKVPGPDRKKIYDDEKEFSHESYGMVGFSRVQGSTGRIFGSSLPDQSTFIRLRVTRGTRRHHLGRDWYHGDHKTMVELDLSAAQFAELLTSMNMGSGIPCTLRFAEGRQMEKCPEEKLEAQQVRDDFKEKVAQVAQNMNDSRKKIDSILAKPNITKADRKEVESLLELIVQDVRSNMPFWLDQFQEATGKIITSAKAEIDSFMTHAVMTAGYKALGEAVAPITVPALLTEGTAKPLTKEQKAELKKDFLEYTGGFTPDEAADEVEKYVQYSCPNLRQSAATRRNSATCTKEQLQEFFDEWAEQAEKESK